MDSQVKEKIALQGFETINFDFKNYSELYQIYDQLVQKFHIQQIFKNGVIPQINKKEISPEKDINHQNFFLGKNNNDKFNEKEEANNSNSNEFNNSGKITHSIPQVFYQGNFLIKNEIPNKRKKEKEENFNFLENNVEPKKEMINNSDRFS